MDPVVFRLDLHMVDDGTALFGLPDGSVALRLSRQHWLDAGRPSQLHVGVSDSEQRGLDWLR